MASYRVRVELQGASRREYVALQAAMEPLGFIRARAWDVASTYINPAPEFRYEGTLSAKDVARLAQRAASVLRHKYSIAVADAGNPMPAKLDLAF